MEENTHAGNKKEGAKYDKILKENVDSVVHLMVENQLNINIVKRRQIPIEHPKTLGKRPDILELIEDSNGNKYVLHVEYQAGDSPQMIHRMHIYHSLLLEKYKVPIHSFVLYFGEKPPTMVYELPSEQIFSGFKLITAASLHYDTLLQSENPEEVIMAIWAKFPIENSKECIRRIVRRLEAICHDQLDLNKYFVQLEVLSNLRKLEPITREVMEEIIFPEIFQNSAIARMHRAELKLDRLEQERQQALNKAIIHLIEKDVLSDEEIAQVMSVSVDYVLELKQQDA